MPSQHACVHGQETDGVGEFATARHGALVEWLWEIAAHQRRSRRRELSRSHAVAANRVIWTSDDPDDASAAS